MTTKIIALLIGLTLAASVAVAEKGPGYNSYSGGVEYRFHQTGADPYAPHLHYERTKVTLNSFFHFSIHLPNRFERGEYGYYHPRPGWARFDRVTTFDADVNAYSGLYRYGYKRW
ncbi:MAG: hypothetical protein HYT43_02025 [Candidatus Taylorbacteria bacterium]|nr:hypothetical protein [Candidatus Taylorbacteria bacterium]